MLFELLIRQILVYLLGHEQVVLPTLRARLPSFPEAATRPFSINIQLLFTLSPFPSAVSQ